MSVLTKEEILKAVENKEIQITPYNKDNVGCASIDLTLSDEFRYFKPGLSVVDVTENVNYKNITEKVTLKPGETYLLLPGQACLGIFLSKFYAKVSLLKPLNYPRIFVVY
jgi:deoxycytidine triphosphate deaminase